MFGAEYSERVVLAKKTAAGTVSRHNDRSLLVTLFAGRTPRGQTRAYRDHRQNDQRMPSA